ncbi:hypothetical protein Tco_0293990 [Tanacetum coccineum]
MRSYFLDSSQENQIKSRPRDYSFKEWLKFKIRHTNINKIVKNAVLNEWVLDCFDEESETNKDPFLRSLEEYKLAFDMEIEQLADEYELDIGKKGYVLDDIWEKCEHVHEGTIYSWHDEGFEEEEHWESGLDEKYYDPPQVCVETIKVKRYTFENKQKFICVTKILDKDLPLGRVNGSRFKGMIRKEIDTGGSVQMET